jgi:small nuclear ribonucleoprotein (snRNP)-like protein
MLAAIAGLLIAAPGVHAQTSLPANSRVRVELRDGHRVIGRLTHVSSDTLVVIDEGLILDSTHRIPTDRMRRIDVSRGKYVHAGRVIGGGLLGAVGAFVLAALVPGLVDQCSADVCESGAGLGVAMLVGIAGGVTLGMLTPADHWEAVPPPVRVGSGGHAQYRRIGISLAF